MCRCRKANWFAADCSGAIPSYCRRDQAAWPRVSSSRAPQPPAAIREVDGAQGHGWLRHAWCHHETPRRRRSRRRGDGLARTKRGTAEAGQAAYGQASGDRQGRLHRLREEGRSQARSGLRRCAEAHTGCGKVDCSWRPGGGWWGRCLHCRLDGALGAYSGHKGQDQTGAVRHRGCRGGRERRGRNRNWGC